MTASHEKLPMKQRILQTADRLFYQHGIQAVGVDTIAAEVGISKRTLYNHFPCKNDLVAAYLSGRSDQLPASDKPPAEQILWNFDRMDRAFATPDFRGCPFINAIGELGDNAEAEIKRIAREFKENRRVWFRERLRELKVANVEELATQLQILVDGAPGWSTKGGVSLDYVPVLDSMYLSGSGAPTRSRTSGPSRLAKRDLVGWQFPYMLQTKASWAFLGTLAGAGLIYRMLLRPGAILDRAARAGAE